MVYYGITMHTGNIGGNIYFNFFILGVVDIPAKLFVMATINRSGKKRIHCLCMLIGGIACLCTIFKVLYGGPGGFIVWRGPSWSWWYGSWIYNYTTYGTSAHHHLRGEFKSSSGEVYSIQHYVIKFVSDLRQVSGFLRVTFFPPPIKLTARI
jgi:hypothetical protein